MSRARLELEAGSLVEPFPLGLGRGIEESSRDGGRFVVASSSIRCLSLFEGTRWCTLGNNCVFLEDAGMAVGRLDGGIVDFLGEGDCWYSSRLARDDLRFRLCVMRGVDGVGTSSSAFEGDRLRPDLSGEEVGVVSRLAFEGVRFRDWTTGWNRPF